MDIYTKNYFLKKSLLILLSDISNNNNHYLTAIIDLNSPIDVITPHWNIYKKLIVLINDISDVLLFNNVSFNGEIYYIDVSLNFSEFKSRLLSIADGNTIHLSLTYNFSSKKNKLSKRQLGVLKLTANGYNLAEVSNALGISAKLSSGYLLSALKRINKKMNLVTFNKIKYLHIY